MAAMRGHMLDIRDFGATAGCASAAIQAALDVLPVSGGSLHIPPGDWACSATITVTKPVIIRGDAMTDFGGTRLVFAAGLKGIDVQLATEGLFQIDTLTLRSQSVAYGAGQHGVHMRNGRGVFRNLCISGFGDHGLFIDTTVAADNANLCYAERLRAYSNRGDGIRLEGSDSNMCTFVAADVVANYGWGINNLEAHNSFIHTHADQQYNGSPGAFHDNGIASDWHWPYSENGGIFHIDTESSYGRASIGGYGAPPITLEAAPGASWEITNKGHARAVRIKHLTGTNVWRLGPHSNPNHLDLRDETNAKALLSIENTGTLATWGVSHRPGVAGIYDLGSATNPWRDAHLSRYLRVGSIYLRDNAGALEQSTDAITWAPV